MEEITTQSNKRVELSSIVIDDYVGSLVYDDSRGVIEFNYKVVVDGDVVEENQQLFESRVSPFNLLNITGNSREASRLRQLIEDIISRKIPTPTQIKYYQEMHEHPNSLIAQLCIRACRNSDCICPLMYSPLGCVELNDLPIDGYPEKYSPSPLRSRKIIMRGLSTIRQICSWEEYVRLLTRFQVVAKDAALIQPYG